VQWGARNRKWRERKWELPEKKRTRHKESGSASSQEKRREKENEGGGKTRKKMEEGFWIRELGPIDHTQNEEKVTKRCTAYNLTGVKRRKLRPGFLCSGKWEGERPG